MIVGKRRLWFLKTSTESKDYTRRDVRGFITLLYFQRIYFLRYPFSPPITFSSTVKNVFPFTIRTCQRAGSLRSLNCCQIIMQLLLLAAPHANSTESGDLMQPRYRTPFSPECLFLRSRMAQERDREVKEPEADKLAYHIQVFYQRVQSLLDQRTKHPRLIRVNLRIVAT